MSLLSLLAYTSTLVHALLIDSWKFPLFKFVSLVVTVLFYVCCCRCRSRPLQRVDMAGKSKKPSPRRKKKGKSKKQETKRTPSKKIDEFFQRSITSKPSIPSKRPSQDDSKATSVSSKKKTGTYGSHDVLEGTGTITPSRLDGGDTSDDDVQPMDTTSTAPSSTEPYAESPATVPIEHEKVAILPNNKACSVPVNNGEPLEGHRPLQGMHTSGRDGAEHVDSSMETDSSGSIHGNCKKTVPTAFKKGNQQKNTGSVLVDGYRPKCSLESCNNYCTPLEQSDGYHICCTAEHFKSYKNRKKRGVSGDSRPKSPKRADSEENLFVGEADSSDHDHDCKQEEQSKEIPTGNPTLQQLIPLSVNSQLEAVQISGEYAPQHNSESKKTSSCSDCQLLMTYSQSEQSGFETLCSGCKEKKRNARLCHSEERPPNSTDSTPTKSKSSKAFYKSSLASSINAQSNAQQTPQPNQQGATEKQQGSSRKQQGSFGKQQGSSRKQQEVSGNQKPSHPKGSFIKRSYDYLLSKPITRSSTRQREQGPIKFYHKSQPFFEFTNFYPVKIVVEDEEWPTSEHYFQGQKYIGTPLYREMRECHTPGGAFALSRSPIGTAWRRGDWENVKLDVMYIALFAKFTQTRDLNKKLLATGKRRLVEHTDKDNFWGDGGDGLGENHLGKLLMRLREELSSPSNK